MLLARKKFIINEEYYLKLYLEDEANGKR